MSHVNANLHAYVFDSSEIFCTVITKIKLDTQAACNTEGTSMLVQLEPGNEINLGAAPNELVPWYFVNSLLCDQLRSRRACSFAQSCQGLAAY